MIFDSLKNSALYYPVSPRLEKAFGFIASTDWETMEPGIHELDGKDIYVNVMEPEPVSYTHLTLPTIYSV